MTAMCEHQSQCLPSSPAEQRTRRIPALDEASGVALALGGGFARGFAHLGVLAVLEEEQVPISAIVGTSIGGLLGAAYADGLSVRELCDLGRRVHIRDFIRFHQSRPGSRGKDLLGQFVREWLRARAVEELSIPTAIVTTDLDTGAPLVFVRGPLEVAIRASCAFPGLFKPVEYEGRLLADGCIVSPVPTAVAARITSGCVLGVAVEIHRTSAGSPRSRAGTLDLAGRTARKSHQPSWVRHADVLVEPAVHDIDWNEFSRVDEAFEAGAEAMRQALPSVRELLDRRSQFAPAPGFPAGAERWLVL